MGLGYISARQPSKQARKMPGLGPVGQKYESFSRGVIAALNVARLWHFVLVLVVVLVLERGGSGVLQKLRTERWTRIPPQIYVETSQGRRRGRERLGEAATTRTIERGCPFYRTPPTTNPSASRVERILATWSPWISMIRSFTVPPVLQAARSFFATFSMTETGRWVAKS